MNFELMIHYIEYIMYLVKALVIESSTQGMLVAHEDGVVGPVPHGEAELDLC